MELEEARSESLIQIRVQPASQPEVPKLYYLSLRLCLLLASNLIGADKLIKVVGS